MDRRLLCGALALGMFLAGCGDSGPLPPPTSSGSVGGSALVWKTYDRDAQYTGTTKLPTQYITLRDGVKLAADVVLPTDASGQAVSTPLPVILVQTGYNKNVGRYQAGLAGANAFLVERGYAQVIVDVRGTGNSEGDWEAFSQTEQQDYKEVLDWIVQQSFSNGAIGTYGPSFMAITQLFTAAWQHPAHKAVFAIVPMGDAYRDITFSGGQVNVGFIPLWMGLVTALSIVPPEPDPSAVPVIAEHVVNALTNFQVPTIAQAALGANGQNFDGPFWRTRSPLEVTSRIQIPTFIVGGLNDIFQRGEPLLYESLKGHTTTKLLIGPWQHLGGSMGEGLPKDGVPDLDHLALAWFDRYLKGLDTGAETMPPVTQYYYGAEKYVTASDWPNAAAQAQRWYLRGDGGLTREPPAASEANTLLLQQPLNGICSQSTAQWTAGVLGLLPVEPACLTRDNRINEGPLREATFTTPVLAEDYAFNGPIEADLFVATTANDADVLVRVTDVSPDGSSRELTNGILTASLAQIDETRSRYLDGSRIQPWHPFTAESQKLLTSGEVTPISLEIFPTSAVIKQGHALRITVGASDFPHGLPPVSELVNMPTGLLTLYSDAEHPSSVVLPAVPLAVLE